MYGDNGVLMLSSTVDDFIQWAAFLAKKKNRATVSANQPREKMELQFELLHASVAKV